MDDASRGIWVVLMRKKGEVTILLQSFIALVKNQFDKNVQIIRSDNGLEFKTGTLLNFYSKNGILRQISCVDTPQQNGRVERKHRLILNLASAQRFQAYLL